MGGHRDPRKRASVGAGRFARGNRGRASACIGALRVPRGLPHVGPLRDVHLAGGLSVTSGKERCAPVNGTNLQIPWNVHLAAWHRHRILHGPQQSAERIAERGGFGEGELDLYVPGWRSEILPSEERA